MTVEEALRVVDHSTRTGDIYRAARALAAEVRRMRAEVEELRWRGDGSEDD